MATEGRIAQAEARLAELEAAWQPLLDEYNVARVQAEKAQRLGGDVARKAAAKAAEMGNKLNQTRAETEAARDSIRMLQNERRNVAASIAHAEQQLGHFPLSLVEEIEAAMDGLLRAIGPVRKSFTELEATVTRSRARLITAREAAHRLQGLREKLADLDGPSDELEAA